MKHLLVFSLLIAGCCTPTNKTKEQYVIEIDSRGFSGKSIAFLFNANKKEDLLEAFNKVNQYSADGMTWTLPEKFYSEDIELIRIQVDGKPVFILKPNPKTVRKIQ